ncbi:MAG TPA: type II toxin-antitoxin system VapC family toxin [Rhizomicrobium sp.]|jgi:PIN domain nuclease of toxin-antitoxin system|nr:type II toxin-antitoxin system VapC family toxin [Rhizomicrobium sp.]
MQLLLDTHAFLWWLAGDPQLSVAARKAIGGEDNTVFVSAASAWEITTKHRLGKLPGAGAVAADVAGTILDQSFVSLPISVRHGQAAGALPGPHRDPFDRMLIAQAMLETLTLITNENVFDYYGVARLW